MDAFASILPCKGVPNQKIKRLCLPGIYLARGRHQVKEQSINLRAKQQGPNISKFWAEDAQCRALFPKISQDLTSPFSRILPLHCEIPVTECFCPPSLWMCLFLFSQGPARDSKSQPKCQPSPSQSSTRSRSQSPNQSFSFKSQPNSQPNSQHRTDPENERTGQDVLGSLFLTGPQNTPWKWIWKRKMDNCFVPSLVVLPLALLNPVGCSLFWF